MITKKSCAIYTISGSKKKLGARSRFSAPGERTF